MPAPKADVFDRLSARAAIEASAVRQRRTIAETFTGDPLGSVPVGIGIPTVKVSEITVGGTKAKA